MKKIFFIPALATAVICYTACGNNKGSSSTGKDSSATLIPPPDNSSATNPSMADRLS